MSTVNIRSMRWSDIPRVHEIETKCFPHDRWSVDQFWRELAGETRDYLVAESDSAVIGYAGVATSAPESDLQTLAVDPNLRKVGVGAALLDAAVSCASRRGATSMILEVRADNAAAHNLYSQSGFESIATRHRYYADGGDALIMRRRPLKEKS